MIVCITGTPGTGKSSVAQELDGFEVLGLTEFIKENNLGEKTEEIEVEIDEVVEAVEKDLADGTVVESHLSHYLNCDLCIVLRCRPDILEERLSERDYSKQKIAENVEAETLDIVLSEAVEKQENILEIDTTGRTAEDVAEEIKNKIEKNKTGYGNIDWTSYL